MVMNQQCFIPFLLYKAENDGKQKFMHKLSSVIQLKLMFQYKNLHF